MSFPSSVEDVLTRSEPQRRSLKTLQFIKLRRRAVAQLQTKPIVIICLHVQSARSAYHDHETELDV